MLDFFWQLDKNIFIAINSLPHNLILNSFFSFLSVSSYWLIVWLFLSLFYFIKYGAKNKKSILASVLSLSLTFLLVNLGLKPFVGRARPQDTIPSAIIIGEPTVSGSFPSAHAAAAFALAYIFARAHPRKKIYLYLIAFLVCLSRIYLGKHYPSDVVAGAGLGLLIGFISLKAVNSTPGVEREVERV